MTQHRKTTPWEKRAFLPLTPQKKKQRSVFWPVAIAGGSIGLILLVLAIVFIINAQSKSTSPPSHAIITPTSATQGLEQYLMQVAQNSGPVGSLVASKYNANNRSLSLNDALALQANTASTRTAIEHDCFVIQRALWKSTIRLATVVVVVSAPGVDLHGQVKMAPAGLCKVTEKTARSLNWDSVSIHQAWITYDGIWMAPSLQQ